MGSETLPSAYIYLMGSEKVPSTRYILSDESSIPFLGFGMQIPELLSQRKFVSARCHAHCNPHHASLFRHCATPTLTPTNSQNCNSYSFDARPKTVAPTVLMLEQNCNSYSFDAR